MRRPIHCAWCNKLAYLETGAVNRAKTSGAPLYCGRECSGFGRRKNKTDAQKRAEKAAYDREYRARNLDWIKETKREYFAATYDPIKAAEDRKKTMARHVEYCRNPEYRVKKSQYDRRRRAEPYGQFAEAFMLLIDLDKEVNARASDYAVRVANGTLNKKLQRRRQYDQFNSSEP